MSLLSVLLAQSIVQRTMSILPQNINVMDEQGIILGSGDPMRLGERHEGAVLAISQERTVEIDELTAHRLQGVRPGVNLPLHHDGKVIGAIGITGQPDEVRQFGELVRMTAEMMLDQRQLLQTIERDSRMSEELVLQLIERTSAPDEPLQQWAARLDVDLLKPRVALVIQTSGMALNEESGLEALQILQRRLSQDRRGQLTARRSLNEFVVLYPALDRRGQWDANALSLELHRWLEDIQRDGVAHIHAALGHYFSQDGSIALSYQTARATLLQPQAQRPLLQAFEQRRLPVLLSPLASGWQAELFRLPVSRLAEHDKDQLLYHTLLRWFEHDLHYAQTAAALHIHRNTLDYRLQKIAELTHLNLDKLEERMQLYIAVQLDQLPH
ncbi:sugar diacid recognition domain-containing protein [uncultured Deefgea sp.]|uniref:sugar diacid recognition domain-containing protein n=1 Tax=uncultured Deefgea sp. TaxID=1304914 RepID=UPI002609E018|nr:sugar diacid recognition domain-containing protein [uncultured Deefgea sp.]